jgi:putative ABC transport system permease protein
MTAPRPWSKGPTATHADRRRATLTTMWKATLRGLFARRLRLALTLAAIVLGVAFVSATYILTDTLSAVIDRLFVNASLNVDVAVRSTSDFGGSSPADRARMPAETLEAVRAAPGVKAADGLVIGLATVVPKDGGPVRPRAGPGLGFSWPAVEDLGPLRLRDGRPPRNGNEIVVDVSTLNEADLEIGDFVRITSTGPAREFRIVGTMTYGDASSSAWTLSAFDLVTAQQLFEAPNQFDLINVQAVDGVSNDTLVQNLSLVIPPGTEALDAVTAARQDAQTLQDGLAFFEALVLVFAGVGVFVGAFIIFNTFGVLVAQRGRELGLLRALGAEPRQVRRSVLAEAAVLGAIGGAAGLVAGVGLATVLLRLLEFIGVGIPDGPLRLLPRTILVALAVGIVVTVVASLLPARRAARTTPVEALSDVQARDEWRMPRRDTVIGVVLLCGAAGSFARATIGEPPYPLVWFGAAALLLYVGISWLAPLAARPVARGLGAVLAPTVGVSGALARENTLRNARRSATTAATLMVGVSLMALTAIAAASARASIGTAIDTGLDAQLVLSGPELFPFSLEARDAVAEQPEVAVASAVRLGNVRVDGVGTRVAAVVPAEFASIADLDVRGGSLTALAPGAVLVHEGVAKANDWEVGEEVVIEYGRTGPQPSRIAGIFKRNQLVFASYVIPMETYRDGFGTQQDSFVYVKFRRSVDSVDGRAAVQQAVQLFPTVQVHDREEFSSTLDDQVQRALGVIWALLALAVLTGVLGIVNTLALSVFERTRELGLLRTVGMARRQVWTMIGGEAVLIALVGALLGVGIGSLLGWALARILADDGVDVFAIPYVQLVAFLVLSGVAGVVASIGPAWRASRLDVLDAIAHE